jgi:hypothetical protein
MLSNKRLSLLFLGALTWLLLLGSPTNAAPIGTSIESTTPDPTALSLGWVEKAPKKDNPEIPQSKEALRKEYFKNAPKKDKSCFFTGMDAPKGKKPAQNTLEAKKQCKAAKLTTLEDIWKKNNILNFGEWKKGSKREDFAKLLVWVSEIFAEESSGASYLLLAENMKPRKESIFFANEFKEIKAKGKVDKIMNVKFEFGKTPTLPDHNKDEHVWWKKGAADPPTRAEKCPDISTPECQ